MATDSNQNTQQRPMLKKVKRPINRTPQAPMGNAQNNASLRQGNNFSGANRAAAQTPAASGKSSADPFAAPQNSGLNNPFISKSNSDDAFNLDAYLDDTPLPAKAAPPQNNNAPRRFLGEEDLPPLQPELPDEPNEEETFYPVSDVPPYLTKKILIMLGALLFFMGIITAKIFFSEEKVVRNGLQGVVVNPEVPKGRARCGVAERTQGCILYLMNPQRQEMPARDFYDLAAQLTGRQRFVIETGNMRYSNTKIRPGDIAQFNIPPL